MATYLVSAAEQTSMRNTTLMATLGLYTLTGFAGVLAEQGFEKYIALLVGATVFSSATVIFAYFLGFGLGAWAIAALARRGWISRPLLTYGVLELLVGASCVAFTYGFHPISAHLAPFQSLDDSTLQKFAFRFAFGAILILPSAALMGASFPLIAQVLAQAPQRDEKPGGSNWVAAYGANLLGASIAALGGAYAILPAIGVRGAMWLCGGIGAVVFAICVLLPEPGSRPAARDAVKTALESIDGKVLLLATALLSGLVFFALEVLWTHLIATLLGASVYAFASMLATVLIGLFIGSIRANRTTEPVSPAAFSKVLGWSALALIIQFRLWDYIQIAYLTQIPAWMKSFYTVEGFKFLLGALLIVPPAALLGTLYPMLLRHPALSRPGASSFVGYLNMANSAGCLAGAILGVFFFIPVLGTEWSLKIIVVALALTGALFLWREQLPRNVLLKTLIPGALLFSYGLTWHWDHLLLTSGQNTWFGRTDKPAEPPKPGDQENNATKIGLAFYEENAQGGFTTVVQLDYAKLPPKRMLLSNGKFEGTDDLEAQGFAQIAVSAIPSQFTQDFGRAVQIGLGTGQSAHTLARMGFETVDIAEYAPGIVHAALGWFQNVNGNVLAEPNVRLRLEDGRNFLQLTPAKSFDVISIEISSAWFAGATNLYSREFYEMAKSRLKAGGALQQWVQFHHTRPRELGVQIATLRSVFPYVSVWSAGGQGMMVATTHPQELTEARRAYLTQRLHSLSNIPESKQAALDAQVFDSRVLTPADVDRLLGQGRHELNTDHNRWIEYATPRYNWTDDDGGAANLVWLKSFANPSQVTAARR
jgi:spermidine synthase